MTNHEKIKKRVLTEEQKVAVKAPMQPGVIIAGAGSGKTTVMAERVFHLINEEGIAGEKILGLTFTNLAAGELKGRIRKELTNFAQKSAQNTTSGEPFVTTYHSFASGIIKQFGMLAGIEPDHQIISDVRRNQLCSRVISKSQEDLRIMDAAFSTILERVLQLDESLADSAISTTELRNFDLKLIQDATKWSPASPNSKFESTAQKRLILSRLVDEFRLEKSIRSMLDYSDMSRIALQLVEEHEMVRTEIKSQYQMVLLDEYQDTSISQRKLLQLLFPSGHPVSAVGDPLQSIYAFRGATSRNISSFTEHFPLDTGEASGQYDLSLTHRNGKNIVQLANALTKRLREADVHPELSELRALEDSPKGPGIVHLASFRTREEEANWIVRKINYAKSKGVPTERIALLLRERDGINWVLKELNKAGIPAQIRTKTDLLLVPEIVELISMLRVIAEPAANSSWVRILTGARWQIGNRDLAMIGRRASQLAHNGRITGKRDLEGALAAAVAGSDLVENAAYGDAISDIAWNGHKQLSAEALERIRVLNDEIDYLRLQAGEPLKNFVYRVASVSGLLIESIAESDRLKRGMDSNLRSFFSLVSDFVSLDGETNLFAFLRWLDESAKYKKKVEITGVAHKGAVQLVTIHSAKGLEFEAVIMPQMAEGIFPSSEGTDNWVTNSFVPPLPLRDEFMHSILASYPERSRIWDSKYEAAYDQARKENDAMEERRLAYVGVTRAEKFLFVSTSAQDPTVKKLRKPSVFFEEILDTCKNNVEEISAGHIVIDEIFDFDSHKNEVTQESITGNWPVEFNSKSMQRIRASAERVTRLIENQVVPDPLPGSLADDWDKAIIAIEKEIAEYDNPIQKVTLPESLSVTQIQRLAKNEDAFIADLIRPMPSEPIPAAARGTAFHAFVENWARQAQGGSVLATLPDMDSADVVEQERIDLQDLDKFKVTFRNSIWAKQVPHIVEAPFAISLGGYIVRGRIDAVYKDGDTYTLVDWKTNAEANADPLQLAIYRLAWADSLNIPLENIKASFYYVALDETVTPETFPSREEIIKILT